MQRKETILLVVILSLIVRAGALAQEMQPDQLEKAKAELAQAESQDDKISAARAANQLGFHYWTAGEWREASAYFEKSLQINTELGNNNAVANLNNYLGLIWSDLKDYEKAAAHLNAALQIRQSQNDRRGVYSELLNLSVVFRQKEDFARADELIHQALEIAKELNDIQMIRRCYGALAENYQSLQDPDKSLEYFNLFTALDKEIQRQEREKIESEARSMVNVAEQKTQAALAEKEQKEKQLRNTSEELNKVVQVSKERQMQIELLNKENRIKELLVQEQEARLRNESLLRKSMIGGLALALIIAGMLFLGFRQKQKANVLLAKQNKEINKQKDQIEAQQLKLAEAYVELREQNQKVNRSIMYGQRIQQAMLSHWDNIYRNIPESFVFFKPRDHVSGDFYYYKEIKGPNPKHVIAAVDCTGHGIPGAFMSMIGYELLHEILDLKKIHAPDRILTELHFGVRKALKQEVTHNKDGMDMSLVVYDPQAKTLEYAGARNSMYYIQGGKLKEVKGDRQSIGGIPDTDEKAFNSATVKIDGPAAVYLFSDGYQDQFGGENGDKFLPVNFKRLLSGIHQLPLDEQHAALEKRLKEWQGDAYPQIDDILVIGFRVA